jgi:prophage maintenance system killer protein
MASRASHFDIDRQALESIFERLDQFRGIADGRDRITDMAARILYRIAESRPFFNGNKRSPAVACIKFLNWNGYHLPLFSQRKKVEMHELLTGIQRQSKGFDDVRAFLKRSVVTFQSR